jgi:hypothetical protein
MILSQSPNNSLGDFQSTLPKGCSHLELSGDRWRWCFVSELRLFVSGFVAQSVVRLHFLRRSCCIDSADADQGKNRARRPHSFIGFVRALEISRGTG